MFRTLRSKLIFSYVGIALLCLLLAVLGTLALARDYAQREGYTTLQEKWSLTMPLLRATLVAQRRPNSPATALVLTGIQTAIRNADVRLLLLDPATLRVMEDTSGRYSAVGQQVDFGLDGAALQNALASDAGVRGTFRFNGETENVQFIARRIRAVDLTPNGGNPNLDAPALYDVMLAQPQPRLLTGMLGTLRDALFPALALALLVSLLAAYFLARSISHPVSRLAEATVAMAKGDYSRRVNVQGQDELAALSQQFNEMASEIGRAHAVQRDFIANVSHDLKTPLTSIQGFSQAMLDGTIHDDAAYHQAAGIINAESQRMSRLVTELLTLANLESGLVTLELHPVDLRDIIGRLILAMQPQAKQAHIELSARMLSSPAPVLADVDKLQQAFGNLVDNAIKHTPQGGKVTLDLGNIPGGVLVKVIDSGEGIPAADLPRVMERFYQIDKSRASNANSDDRRGIGIGLAIARQIINAHRGGITIESTEGKGTTVLVSLPGDTSPHPPAASRRTTQPLNGHTDTPSGKPAERVPPARS
jgi:signal transduction histidine kinase